MRQKKLAAEAMLALAKPADSVQGVSLHESEDSGQKIAMSHATKLSVFNGAGYGLKKGKSLRNGSHTDFSLELGYNHSDSLTQVNGQVLSQGTLKKFASPYGEEELDEVDGATSVLGAFSILTHGEERSFISFFQNHHEETKLSFRRFTTFPALEEKISSGIGSSCT
ncbi:MAG: hypothetical protein LUC43_09915 [Burkholderiales bacterium]|nr:hypothetical protein [Burkholderiales bacterium]